MDDALIELRRAVAAEYFTQEQLASLLPQKRARIARLSRWSTAGKIIRLKPGLFVFSQELRRGPLPMFLLANVLYGPSYVSLHSALSYYGFIPEGVPRITSVNKRRSKHFITRAGIFDYSRLQGDCFAVGVVSREITGANVLIATPEKALLDLLYFNAPPATGIRSVSEYLQQSMRIDEEQLQSLKGDELKDMAASYRRPVVIQLVEKLVSELHPR